ncbi:hypothetical protein ACOSQ2_027392 [Xanthoceras sorbifolium]
MQRNSKVLSSTMDDGTSRNLFNTPEPKGNGKSNKRLSTTNPDVLNSLHKDCGFILNQLKKEVYEYFNCILYNNNIEWKNVAEPILEEDPPLTLMYDIFIMFEYDNDHNEVEFKPREIINIDESSENA